MRKIEGFTLVELLIVIVIIGLLAGIVGPKLFKNIGKSETATARVQVETLSKALDNYRIDVGHYPTQSEGLKALQHNMTNNENWNGPYLKKELKNDPWGYAYQYSIPGKYSDDYDVYSLGKDNQEGGELENKDIGNW